MYSRRYVNDVRNCEEMERSIRYLESEVKHHDFADCKHPPIVVKDVDDKPDALRPEKVFQYMVSLLNYIPNTYIYIYRTC